MAKKKSKKVETSKENAEALKEAVASDEASKPNLTRIEAWRLATNQK